MTTKRQSSTFFKLHHRDACATPSAPGLIGTFLFVPSRKEVLSSGQAARQTPRPAARRPRPKTRRRKSNLLPPAPAVVPPAVLHVDRARLAAPAPAVRAGEPAPRADVRPPRAAAAAAAPRAPGAPRHRGRRGGDAPAARGGLVAARARAAVQVLARAGRHRCACDAGKVRGALGEEGEGEGGLGTAQTRAEGGAGKEEGILVDKLIVSG